jgi:hypothetical protein
MLVTWLSEMVLGARSPEPATAAPPKVQQPGIQAVPARPTAAETAAGAEAVTEPIERRQ